MSDVAGERRSTVRFFCHRCNIEFADVLQDYTCPYCASGFIEQLETRDASAEAEFSDADMSNIDDMSSLGDSDEVFHLSQGTPPMLNDLAFLMSGGRLPGAGRPRETLMEQLVWMIGGTRAAPGAVTAGAPLVLVGAPGDYVFGGEGLDAVVTQLLGQLENAGPPPLPGEQIAGIDSVQVTEEQVASNASCSICWENFQAAETVSRLECNHIFHPACISPWLQLHATCPVCRHSLLPETNPPNQNSAPPTDSSASSVSQLVVRRVGRSAWDGGSSSGSGRSGRSGRSARSARSARSGGSWPRDDSDRSAPSARSTHSASDSSSSLNSSERDRQYNMDLDYD